MNSPTGEYLHIRGGPGKHDLMTWPNPDDPTGTEWRLRYHKLAGEPSGKDLMAAASYMHAYRALIGLPQRERNQRVSQIRAAAKAARQGGA